MKNILVIWLSAILLAAAVVCATALGCSSNECENGNCSVIGVICEKDSDCGVGYRCDPPKGCVAVPVDGGPQDVGHHDGGRDARPPDGGDVETDGDR